MLTHDEKRNYIRMNVDCDIHYRAADSQQTKIGKCITLSGAGVSFVADTPFEAGSAMEISITPKILHHSTHDRLHRSRSLRSN